MQLLSNIVTGVMLTLMTLLVFGVLFVGGGIIGSAYAGEVGGWVLSIGSMFSAVVLLFGASTALAAASVRKTAEEILR